MFTLKREIETLFLIVLATFICLFFLLRLPNKVKFNIAEPTLPSLSVQASIPAPEQPMSFSSPDGTKTLIMKKQEGKEQVIYSFYISSSSEPEKLIFTKSVDLSNALSVPFNTWSPDNAYVFIKETESGQDHYFVLSSVGKTFVNSSPYISVDEIFLQKYPDNFKLTDVTGWGSPTLLVVNTGTEENKIGPSLWFEIPSQVFIQLSTRFN